MTAYVVFCLRSVDDGAALQRYRAVGMPSLAAHGGRIVAGPGIAASLEGEALQGAVMAAFESVEAARGWYDSAEYQAAAAIRQAASTGFGFIVEGRD